MPGNKDRDKLFWNAFLGFSQLQPLPPCRHDQVQELAGLQAKGSGLGPKELEVRWGGAGPRPAHKGLRCKSPCMRQREVGFLIQKGSVPGMPHQVLQREITPQQGGSPPLPA